MSNRIGCLAGLAFPGLESGSGTLFITVTKLKNFRNWIRIVYL